MNGNKDSLADALGQTLEALLLGAGFEVIDLGVDLPAERFVEAVRAERPDILSVGAYMSTTMLLARDVLDALEQAGLRDTVWVMVGGVPTTQRFADEIGADGWAQDATGAARKALELMERR
jgi:5-methyltetrahydrofolate--homocysteine methyltransferase